MNSKREVIKLAKRQYCSFYHFAQKYPLYKKENIYIKKITTFTRVHEINFLIRVSVDEFETKNILRTYNFG